MALADIVQAVIYGYIATHGGSRLIGWARAVEDEVLAAPTTGTVLMDGMLIVSAMVDGMT